MRQLALMLITVVVLNLATTARAQEPHVEWLKFMEGSWEFEFSNGTNGELSFKFAKGRHSLIGQRETNRGKAVQLIGWRPDKKVLVDTYYATDGSYFVIEYGEINRTKMVGEILSNDGATGKTVVTKENENLVTVKSEQTTSDGQSEKLTGTFRRKDK